MVKFIYLNNNNMTSIRDVLRGRGGGGFQNGPPKKYDKKVGK